MTTTDPTRRCAPIVEWPEVDQHAWHAGRAGGDLFDSSEASFRWRPITYDRVAVHYGRWITFLKVSGLLDPAMEPAARITETSLRGYVEHLNRHCTRTTVASRVRGLVHAILVMDSKANLRRLRLLAAKAHQDSLPAPRPPEKLRPISELYGLGLRIIDEANKAEKQHLLKTAVQFRDGLMIAMLAARPLRLRDFLPIRIGYSLERQGDRYWLHFPTSKTKHAKPYNVPLPDELNPLVEKYLTVHRLRLLRGAEDTHFWINQLGNPLQESGIRWALGRWTTNYLGVHLSPHDFRHCAVTSVATEDPEHVQMCASLLGHRSLDSSTRHYNHATALDASRRYHALIEKLREAL